MNCEACSERLPGYIDGMLEPRDLLQVEQHLRRCGICAADLEQLRAAVAMLSALQEVPVPASFRASLHSRLVQAAAELPAADKVRRLPTRSAFRWAIPAATAAAAAAIVIGLWQNQPPGQQPVVPPATSGQVAVTEPPRTPIDPKNGTTVPQPPVTVPVGPSTPPKDPPVVNPAGQNPETGGAQTPPVAPVQPATGGSKDVPAPDRVSVASLPAGVPATVQPAGAYTQLNVVASYRGANVTTDAAQISTFAAKVGGRVSEQAQAVNGGFQYTLEIPKDKMVDFFADLGRTYVVMNRMDTHVDITTVINPAVLQYNEAVKSGVEKDIEIAKAYLVRVTNLRDWAGVRITLSK